MSAQCFDRMHVQKTCTCTHGVYTCISMFFSMHCCGGHDAWHTKIQYSLPLYVAPGVCMYVFVCVCAYVCLYVCMYVCIYMKVAICPKLPTSSSCQTNFSTYQKVPFSHTHSSLHTPLIAYMHLPPLHTSLTDTTLIVSINNRHSSSVSELSSPCVCTCTHTRTKCGH